MIPEPVLYDMNAWDHVIAVIICIFAPVLAITSRKLTTEEITLESDDKIRLYHSNALLLIVFGLIVTTTWRIPGRPLEGLGLDWPYWHPYVSIILASILIFYLLDIYFQYGSKKKRERSFIKKQKALAFIPADKRELLHFVFLAIAAGIGEEIIFRGYLIHYIIYWTGNEVTGVVFACIASSALFAFLHGYQGIPSMVKIFLFALLFSTIFILSGSLLVVMVVHALVDIVSGLLSVYLINEMKEERRP